MQTHKYRGGVYGAAPLVVQVTASATHPIYVIGFTVSGDNATGSASRPSLVRPSVPGTGTGTAVALSPSAPAATASLATSFSISPSLPVVSSGSFNLPMRINWNASPGQEFVIGIGTAGLLYANATGGHTWSGTITWEER